MSFKRQEWRSLAENIISMAVMRGIDFLVPLITLPYIVKVSGLGNFGKISSAIALALYFGAFLQYGFAITALRDVARCRNHMEKLSNIVSRYYLTAILLFLVGFFIYLLLIFSINAFRQDFLTYILAFMLVAGQSIMPIWLFQGLEQMKRVAWVTGVTRIIYLLSLLLLVNDAKDYPLVVGLNAFAVWLAVAVSVVVAKRTFGIRIIFAEFNNIIVVLREGWDAFLSQFAPNLYNNSALFILGFYAPSTTVGIYSASSKIIDVLNSGGYIISGAFIPKVARDLASHAIFKKIMLVIGAVLSVLIFIFSDKVSAFLFASSREVAEIVRLLAPSVFFLFATITFQSGFLCLIGKDAVVRNITVVSSLLFFLLGLFIIPIGGIHGSAAMLVGARAMMCGLSYMAYRRYL